MLRFLKNNFIMIGITLVLCGSISACQQSIELPPEPQGKQIDFNKFVGKVIVAEKSPSSVVYEYQDVRVDEVSLLASMYCQDHGNRNAYLEKINLYKNNRRRASFYCSSK